MLVRLPSPYLILTKAGMSSFFDMRTDVVIGFKGPNCGSNHNAAYHGAVEDGGQREFECNMMIEQVSLVTVIANN